MPELQAVARDPGEWKMMLLVWPLDPWGSTRLDYCWPGAV